jgi:HlyD family secretion protein
VHQSPWRLALVVLACSTLIAACAGDQPPVVSTERIRSGEVTQTVSAPARTQAAAQQAVATTVAGTVAAIEAEDTGQVQAGQTVVRLTSPQVDAAQRQAEAARSAAAGDGRITIDSGSKRTLQATRAAVAALDASTQPALAEARAKAQGIPQQHEREAALAVVEAAEHAYQQTRDAILQTGQAAAGQQQALAASLSKVLRQVTAQFTAPARAQAAAATAVAEAQAAQLNVVAPFAGTVQFGVTGGGGTALPAAVPPALADLASPIPRGGGGDTRGGPLRVGVMVSPGQTLFTVYDLSTMYVTAEVDEVDVPQVRLGQRAKVLVDAVPKGSFVGIVERIAIEAMTTEAGGTGYPVRIRIVGPTPPPAAEEAVDLGVLRVGMTGSVEIATKTLASDLVIPSRALLRRGDDTVVFVVRDGVARRVTVSVLTLGENEAAVSGDLRPNDEVVVSGYENLQDGTRVRV